MPGHPPLGRISERNTNTPPLPKFFGELCQKMSQGLPLSEILGTPLGYALE